jgi:hypothetical protein
MRFGRLVSILAAVVLVFSFAMIPMPVHAAEGGSASGQFHVGNAAPTVTSIELWAIGGGAPISDMTPQVEYNVKVDVSDGNTLDDLSTVTVRIFYDADGSYVAGEEAGAADNKTRAILTWTNGVGWSIDPLGGGTSWSLVGENCTKPALSSGSGIFGFHFKPGKVSTETPVIPGTDKWHIFAKAVDKSAATDNGTDENNNMNWFGEITVNTGNVNWGSLAPGTQFDGASSNQSGISVTYISNGAYDEQIAASATWTGGLGATLDATGNCTNINEFSLKANDTDTLEGVGGAILVEASPTYGVIDDTGAQTDEPGDTVTTNTLWLKLSSRFYSETYNGFIYYEIVNGS